MAIHRDHCRVAGFDINNAGVAAALLRPVIGPDAFNSARRAHRARNRALHADLCSTSCPVGGDPRLYLGSGEKQAQPRTSRTLAPTPTPSTTAPPSPEDSAEDSDSIESRRHLVDPVYHDMDPSVPDPKPQHSDYSHALDPDAPLFVPLAARVQ
eukprot:10829840-Alexandrium_andersonii.AAC.1